MIYISSLNKSLRYMAGLIPACLLNFGCQFSSELGMLESGTSKNYQHECSTDINTQSTNTYKGVQGIAICGRGKNENSIDIKDDFVNQYGQDAVGFIKKGKENGFGISDGLGSSPSKYVDAFSKQLVKNFLSSKSETFKKR